MTYVARSKILVVGAGFAGAVHARQLAEAGFLVDVIDQRSHIAGNAFDFVDANGVRAHRYGPHLFHTKMARVISWIEQFGAFLPYRHRVRARLPDGRHVPLPINRDTVNAVFATNFKTAAEIQRHLASIAKPIMTPHNAAEHLYATIGEVLTDLFFRPYTKVMWDLDLEDLSVSVVKRLPLRYDDSDTYFPDDERQFLPAQGYTALFQTILNHPLIGLSLNTAFTEDMRRGYAHCFNAMPIDQYFDFSLGELPYRSIRFHHRSESLSPQPGWSVTNFTDAGKLTRETRWDCLPGHMIENTGRITVTTEEPCDYRDNNFERYYPVKTADNRFHALYQAYRDLAFQTCPTMTFIGRCGTYQYLDMDQVINQSLTSSFDFISRSL